MTCHSTTHGLLKLKFANSTLQCKGNTILRINNKKSNYFFKNIRNRLRLPDSFYTFVFKSGRYRQPHELLLF